MAHKTGLPKVKVSGTAIIRDKNGNVKGSFTFGGDATKEQAAELQKMIKGDSNGSNPDHSRS